MAKILEFVKKEESTTKYMYDWTIHKYGVILNTRTKTNDCKIIQFKTKHLVKIGG